MKRIVALIFIALIKLKLVLPEDERWFYLADE